MRNLLAAAAVAVVVSAPTPARAGGDALPLIGGLVFGTVLGSIITDSRRDYYPPPPVYYAPPPPPVSYRPERQCVTDWHWDQWGRRHWYQRCYWVHAPVYGYGY